METKFNPWHDPDNGQFTFAGTGNYFGGGEAQRSTQTAQLSPEIVARAARAAGAGTSVPGAILSDIFFPEALAPGVINLPVLEQRDLDRTVKDVLKSRKGSIKNAPLEPGSPIWNEIGDLTLKEISNQRNRLGYNTIWKLLTDRRFMK